MFKSDRNLAGRMTGLNIGEFHLWILAGRRSQHRGWTARSRGVGIFARRNQGNRGIFKVELKAAGECCGSSLESPKGGDVPVGRGS